MLRANIIQKLGYNTQVVKKIKKKVYEYLRKKYVYIPLLIIVGVCVLLLLLSPFIPQLQSTAQHITKKHPFLAKILPSALRPPNLSVPSTGNWLIIPSASIKMPIVEGPSINVLVKYVGVWHETGTLNNNYVIAGHKLQYFRSVNQSLYTLDTLKTGDNGVIVDINGTAHDYTVEQTGIVAPTDTAILNQTSSPQLTIYTCNDFFNHARFVVIAKPDVTSS
jgi:LPXTG-site transpeptidase (sortase) family protein